MSSAQVRRQALTICGIVLLTSCSSPSHPSNRGGIGYGAAIGPDDVVVLGTPASTVGTVGEPITIRLGDHVTIVKYRAADPDFDHIYRLDPDQAGIVRVVGATIEAEASGTTGLSLYNKIGRRRPRFCVSRSRCELLLITVR